MDARPHLADAMVRSGRIASCTLVNPYAKAKGIQMRDRQTEHYDYIVVGQAPRDRSWRLNCPRLAQR